MATDLCPCCSQPLPDTGLEVSLRDNAVLFRGKAVRVACIEAEIAYVLADCAPEWVPRERIMQRVYGQGDAPQNSTLKQHILHLRRKLRDGGIPLAIENSWYHGGGGHQYRMIPVSGL